jgi:sialic acid synthase SpsE
MVKALSKKYNTIGFFLCERPWDFKNRIWKAHDKHVFDEEMRDFRKVYNKQKFLSFENALGYNNFFIIKGETKSLDVANDEFVVSKDAKKGEIARAFKKHAASKKTNKIFATQFAKLVA